MTLAIARIWEGRQGERRRLLGTGFAVGSDLGLTAFHCVGDRATGQVSRSKVWFGFANGVELEAEYEGGDPRADFAVIRFVNPLPDGFLPVPLATSAAEHSPFRSLGYPSVLSNTGMLDIVPISGLVTNSQGSLRDGTSVILLQCAEAAATEGLQLHGMSGAPVLTGTPEAAVALIRWNPESADDPRRLAVGGIVCACPMRSVLEKFSALAPHVVDSPPPLARFITWPLPKVFEADCYELGVALSEVFDRLKEHGEVAPYIPRDADTQVLRALRVPRRFVLIVGEAAAGKTRTACELLLRHAPQLPLVVPRSDLTDGLASLIEAYEGWPNRPPEAVLWLDDLQRFLGAKGLTAQTLRRAQDLGLGVVATIRRRELEKFRPAGMELDKLVQDVYDRADVVQLPEGMSADERAAAARLYPDQEFLEGLGETFISGRRLKERLDNGAAELRAAVRAAADWIRVGFSLPIPEDRLCNLFPAYFRSQKPLVDITRELLEQGIARAREPVATYSALFFRESAENGAWRFRVPDFVTDYIEAQDIPILEETWSLAVRSLDTPGAPLMLGHTAQVRRSQTVIKEKIRQGITEFFEPVSETFLDRISEQAWKYGAELGDGECALELGLLLFRRGDNAGAETWWSRSAELGNMRGLYNYGVALHARQELSGAERAWRRAADLGHALAAFNLGRLLKQQGDLYGAEAAWEGGMDLGEPLAAHNLGLSRADRGDSSGAEAAYRQAVTLGSPASAVNLGAMIQARGDTEGAKQAWRAGVRLFLPESPLLATLDLSPSVIQHVWSPLPAHISKRVLEAYNPGSKWGIDFLWELGGRLFQAGDEEAAEIAWREGVKRKSIKCADNLGHMLRHRNDIEEAVEVWRQGVELGSSDAALWLGKTLYERGQKREARAAWEKAVAAGAPYAAYFLGLSLFHDEQDPRAAEAVLRRGIELDSVECAEVLGTILENQNRRDEARSAWRRAVELGSQQAISWVESLDAGKNAKGRD
jgi:tetratricopeptide (TPR) repeat protein